MPKNKTNKVEIQHLFINLNFVNQEQTFTSYFSQFEKEFLQLKNDYHLVVKTIYIATSDSIFLTNQDLKVFLTSIKSVIGSDLIEYSFEIGYQTLTKNQLNIIQNFGVNRLVWKVRTFNKKLLKSINQDFNVKEILSLIKTSLVRGFDNFSIELEDNINLQSKSDIIDDLKIALGFNAGHISYQSNSDYINLDNVKVITDYLSSYNYDNYEFFSFAVRKKYHSQHTLAYLQLKNWYGLGPNAGSFIYSDAKTILINNSNEVAWTKKITTLSQNEYYQLLIIQGLLLRTGFDLENERLLAYKKFLSVIKELIDKDKLIIENNSLKTTDTGWILLNDVLIDIINT